jgi:heptosyltransferase-2
VRAPRFLIIRASAIGDFVLHLPALSALALKHPGARFTLVGYPATLQLAAQFIPVDAIHSIEGEPWRRLFYEPVAELGGFEIDAAFVWMRDAAFADNLRKSGLRDVRRLAPFPLEGHAGDHLLETLGLPAPPLPDHWKPGSNRVILHPGSGSSQKVWPHFAALAAAVPDAVVLLGPCEMDFESPVPRLTHRTLTEVSGELLNCRRFIGCDSGITHLAAYLGCPALALFGPTDPRVWGPVGRRVEILWKTPLADISVEDVIQRI